MPERNINITFPVKENILLSVKETKDEFIKNILFLTALHFYRNRRLSLGKAAELAGYTKMEFIERLNRKNEYVFDYDADEIDEIFNDLKKVK